jgi:TolB-like protein/Flp pilus assembly protein TadD
MSAAHDQEWFSDGISEEILNALAQVDGLRVIGRTSSFSLKGHNEDLREVGRRLDAGTVLEGSVRRAGQRVRITAQLIETAGGSHLWSEQFDRDVVDVFAVQGEIARAVVGQLRLKLLPAAAAKTTPTASAAAHDAYLQGVALMRKGSPEGFEQGRDAMQRAVDLDPGYAEAWSGLARARFWAADQGVRSDPTVEFPRAMEAAERAIALEPGKAHGYLARGALREGIFLDWEGARADLERAASLDRQNTDILSQLGGVLAAMGRLGEARPQIEQSVRLDPLSANSHVMLALLERAEGHADRATAAATRAVELAPESGRAARTLGLALLDQRRFTEARDAFHRSPNPLFSAMGDAMVAHALGDVGTYRRVVETLTGNPQALGGAYQIAQVFAYAADRDRALEWLGHAAETRDAGLIYLTYDPLFAPLRGDPRYQALLARLKLPSR